MARFCPSQWKMSSKEFRLVRSGVKYFSNDYCSGQPWHHWSDVVHTGGYSYQDHGGQHHCCSVSVTHLNSHHCCSGQSHRLNDLTLGCQISHSASSSKFHHLALLALLVALVSNSSNYHHYALLALLALLVALVLH